MPYRENDGMWATREAIRIDPFVSEKPSSILDRKRESVPQSCTF
jgi:hypothetical protein